MTREQKILVRDALGAINPFMLRSETGRLIPYESTKECYQLVLTGLFAEFPAGFVDVPYYMMKYQRLPPKQVFCIVGYRQYAIIPWWDKSPERDEKIRQVLVALLQPSGCRLDDVLFQQALDNLDSLLDKQGVREKLSRLNNIHIFRR